MKDISTSQVWIDVAGISLGRTAKSDWDGEHNTKAIVAQSTESSAADLCDAYTNANYGTGTYSDWYLPSRGELNHLWNNIYEVQKALESDGNIATTDIAENYYWSSTDLDITIAWYFSFFYGFPNHSYKTSKFYVRAVRVF